MNLKTIRMISGCTQKDIAEMLGVSTAAYSRYESGEREPGIEALIRLSAYFHVPVGVIVGTEPVPGDYHFDKREKGNETPKEANPDDHSALTSVGEDDLTGIPCSEPNAVIAPFSREQLDYFDEMKKVWMEEAEEHFSTLFIRK